MLPLYITTRKFLAIYTFAIGTAALFAYCWHLQQDGLLDYVIATFQHGYWYIAILLYFGFFWFTMWFYIMYKGRVHISIGFLGILHLFIWILAMNSFITGLQLPQYIVFLDIPLTWFFTDFWFWVYILDVIVMWYIAFRIPIHK